MSMLSTNLPTKRQLTCLRAALPKRSPRVECTRIWESPDGWVAGDCDQQLRFYVEEPMVSQPTAHDPRRLSVGAIGLNPGDSVGEFPAFHVDRPVESTTGDPVFYPAGSFLLALRHCITACDADNLRYAIGGVMLDSNRVAATDCRRLHWSDMDTGETGHLDKDAVIIPIVAVKVLVALLADCRPADSIVVHVSTTEVTFLGNMKTGSSWKYATRRIEGRFPRIDDVISYTETPSRSESAADYRPDVARAAKIVDKESRGAKLADGAFACRGVDGAFFPGLSGIILDILFIRDALALMDGPTVFGYSDAEHAVRFDSGALHAIIMPMMADDSVKPETKKRGRK